MRPRQYILRPQAVHARATWLCQKHIRLHDHGPKCTAGILWALLIYAACRVSSLAAACAALRDAPGDSAAHDALLATLPNIAELQRRLNRALQGDLPRGLRRRRQPLACDLTLTPYHGQPLHDADEVYRSQAKSGTTHFHAYATAYVVKKGQRFTVALVYVRKGQALKDVLQELLRQAARAGVRPRYLLLDKGFCSVEIIRYLQVARYSWLLPLVARGRKADHPKGASGSQVFLRLEARRLRELHHDQRLGEKGHVRSLCQVPQPARGAWQARPRGTGVRLRGPATALVSRGRPADLPQPLRHRDQLPADEPGRIRTCTRDPLLRLLYVGVALILRNVWVWLHWEALANPRRGGRRIDLSQLRFRQMLLWLQHYAEDWLGIHEEVAAQLPIWV